MVKSSADWSDIPFGEASIFNSTIEFPANVGIIDPLSNNSLVSLLTTIIWGAETYPDPPETIVAIPIVLESFNTIFGDMKASGCKVLSEEYSNPSLIILVLLIIPISLEFKETNKFSPFAEVILEIEGNFLYPEPPDNKCILFAGPDAVNEVVVYSKLSHSVDAYDNLSGDFCKEIWNVDTPKLEMV